MSIADAETNTIDVEKRHPIIGATVRGVDRPRPLDEATVDAIHALWMEHLLLVFPDQRITDEQHIAFGERFGTLEIHPSIAHRSTRNEAIYRVSNVDEAGNIVPPTDTAWQYLSQSWRWHTDSSFREIPSKGSILHGIEITREGGNTLFANMYAAYDALTEEMKTRIAGLWVVHAHDYVIRAAPGLANKQDRGAYEDLPPVRHPIVQVHPVTGRKSLFLSPHTMVTIEGMEERVARTLLDQLIAHATDERFVYRHVWEPDDIIMWDNRCTMHSVEPFDNRATRRIMHRVTLVGEGAPVSA